MDLGDFFLWKREFEETMGSGAGVGAGVPEPSAVVLALAVLLTVPCRVRRARTAG
ncbi:MAG: hypothetical protein L0Z53_21235 [Acidobacteriales bacterium]|nr:hypothetical protein [Terriglobales bacterium]